MGRGINIKGLVIGMIAVFMALMVAAWIIAVQVDPKMVRKSESTPKVTTAKPPPPTLPAAPTSPKP